MKLQITSELNGQELIDIFLQQLKASNVDAAPGDIQILIQSKEKEINLTPDRIKLSYTKIQV